MRKHARFHFAVARAILFAGLFQNAAANDKSDPCASTPYGMTPAALAFWKEGIVDSKKATASIQEMCRMKLRLTSRKPLHELGFSDEAIDRASPLSLLYQSMGAGRFAAQLSDQRSRAKLTPPQKAKRSIRLEDIEMSEQSYQRAVFNLKYNGQMSDQLVQLGRLGVAFQDPSGRARNFGEVLADAATALQRGVVSGRMTKEEAMFFARGAGFYGTVGTAVANNDAGLAAAFKEAMASH